MIYALLPCDSASLAAISLNPIEPLYTYIATNMGNLFINVNSKPEFLNPEPSDCLGFRIAHTTGFCNFQKSRFGVSKVWG